MGIKRGKRKRRRSNREADDLAESASAESRDQMPRPANQELPSKRVRFEGQELKKNAEVQTDQ